MSRSPFTGKGKKKNKKFGGRGDKSGELQLMKKITEMLTLQLKLKKTYENKQRKPTVTEVSRNPENREVVLGEGGKRGGGWGWF